MASITPIASSITAHAWNKDRTRLAICPNSNEIIIFKADSEDPAKWVQEHVLQGHDQLVTCLAWAPQTNRILSCSHDRNAYVWSLSGCGEWEKNLVLVKSGKAATCCGWSCDESKLAIGSSDKRVSVCYYDSNNDWWVPRSIKKHSSTVTALEWHPSNPALLATVSTDCYCRIFSAFTKEVDDRSFKVAGFGNLLDSFYLGAWGLDVTWSPSGAEVAAAAYNSSIFVHELKTRTTTPVLLSTLPPRVLTYITENAIIYAGYHRSQGVIIRNTSSGKWNQEEPVELSQTILHHKKQSALANLRGQFEKQTEESEVSGLHKNDAVSLDVFHDGRGWSTAGMDGRVVIWAFDKVSKPQSFVKMLQV